MSKREHQQDGLQHKSNGNKVISHRTSVIAEAMRYEAVQGTPARDVEKTSSPKSTSDASPSTHYREPAQASVFSAFGKDAAKQEIDGFEGTGRSTNNSTYMDKSPVNDMTKQCSMIHRMMEMDKTDIDPRDLHKLLPSTMLTSESLDLRSNGSLSRINQGAATGMDLHSLLEDQALKFVAETEHPESKSEQEDGVRTSPRAPTPMDLSSSNPESQVPCESPTEAQDNNYSGNNNIQPVEPNSKTPPIRPPSVVRSKESSSSSSSNRKNQSTSPKSPVTGWPAAPVLGIMHPMNHTICRVSRTAEVVTTPPLLYNTDNAPAMLPNPVNLIRSGVNAPVFGDWQTVATFPHQNEAIQQQFYQLSQEDQHHRAVSYQTLATNPAVPPSVSESSHDSSPRKNSSSNEGSHGLDSDKSGQENSEDANGKNFKSLEAALAWCHVQHSQKQVPVVPKDDVRKLVDFQLNSGKPIRAPWYRPQSNKPEEEAQKKTVEKRPMIPRPERPRRSPTTTANASSGGTNNSRKKKQGTGFFCPPGSSMTRV